MDNEEEIIIITPDTKDLSFILALPSGYRLHLPWSSYPRIHKEIIKNKLSNVASILQVCDNIVHVFRPTSNDKTILHISNIPSLGQFKDWTTLNKDRLDLSFIMDINILTMRLIKNLRSDGYEILQESF